jgi:hypothetical protein
VAGGAIALLAWLKGRIDRPMQDAMLPVLENLWSQAFDLGVQFAEDQVGPVHLDPQVKRELLDRLGREWARQISQTRIDRIAEVLRSGGDGSAVQAILDDPEGADLVVRTEAVRAFTEGARAAYEAAGVPEVEWETSHDANVCPNCQANEDAGPQPLGKPFPSGAIQPPQHPRCRCILIPARKS